MAVTLLWSLRSRFADHVVCTGLVGCVRILDWTILQRRNEITEMSHPTTMASAPRPYQPKTRDSAPCCALPTTPDSKTFERSQMK